jgi:hypothetical protein
MSGGLKGVKQMSIGNGNAELLHVNDLKAEVITVQKSMMLPNNVSLLDWINDANKTITQLSKKVTDLENQLSSLQVE